MPGGGVKRGETLEQAGRQPELLELGFTPIMWGKVIHRSPMYCAQYLIDASLVLNEKTPLSKKGGNNAAG